MDVNKNNKETLLIIDDSLQNRKHLCLLLQDEYNIKEADGLHDGRAVLEEDKISAILLKPDDLQDNVSSFFHFIQSKTALARIPVLVLVEDAASLEVVKFFERGTVDCIEKPYNKDVIKKRISNAMLLKDSMTFQSIENMLKQIPSNIWLKDRTGRFIFSTHRMQDPLSQDDPHWTIRGKTDVEVREDKENAIAAMKADREIVATGRGTSYTIEQNINGKQEFYEVIKRPIFADDGSVKGIIGLVNNVTEPELLKRNLERRVRTDEMTGLYNRAYFYEYVRDLPNQDFYPVSIISADCDGLKRVNDTYGHLAGDDYIKASVHLFQKVLPWNSVLFRIGGDEFVFILPSTTEETAANFVEKMKLEAETIQIKDQPVSVSFGIAVLNSQEDSVEEGIALSDENMYREKRDKKQRKGISR